MIYLKEDKAQKLKRKRPLCFEHLLRKYMYLQYANYHTGLRRQISTSVDNFNSLTIINGVKRFL